MSCSFRKMLIPLMLAASFAFLPLRADAAQAEPGGIYCFSPADFSEPGEALTGVCITSLPVPSQGKVMLGSRIIRTGDVLTASQLEQMVFVPVSFREDTFAQVGYLPIFDSGIRDEAVVMLSIRGKENLPPTAEDAAVETYKNLPAEGLLKVSDPEGAPLVFSVKRKPRRGSVIIREDGSFLYTPSKNKVGTDSFTYVAADPAGNLSREVTVTIRILKPSDSLQYSDTVGLSCRFEAEWLRNTGIFSGEQVSGQLCFSPTEGVSRGQFLVMLMDTLGLPVDHSVKESPFADEAAAWLVPYLSAGLRAGIVQGFPCDGGIEFRPEQFITGQEAAVMLHNALDFSVPAAIESDGSIAAWAREASAALSGEGIVLPQGAALVTRSDAAKVLYRISKLQEQTPLLSSFFGS